MSTPGFYRAFEDRFRGSRSLIQQRLQVYLPYVQPLLQLYPPAPAALDLGCGRGEWLELLQSQGFAPQGIDLDEGMLAACREHGLPAVQGDAIAYLRALGDATQAIVSGFHIAEHISFEDLQTLVSEAQRVLKPGGLLILETPNPENIVVGSHSFYLDPTHQRPLPPNLLSFLPEHLGYARVKVLRLQEESRLVDSPRIQLIDVLGGVSPDYAVVAQKAASPEVLLAFDAAFDLVHGIGLETLAQRFDDRIPPPIMQEELIARIQTHLDAQLAPLIGQVIRSDHLREAAEVRALAAEARALAAEAERQSLHVRHLHEMAQAQALAEEAQNQIAQIKRIHIATEERALGAETLRDALLQSRSWRMTAGLRAVSGWSAGVSARATLSQAAAQVGRYTLVPLMRAVLKKPRLSHRLKQTLKHFPFLHQRLVSAARQGGIVVNLQTYGMDDLSATPPGSTDLAALTPEARKIYRHFKEIVGQPSQPSQPSQPPKEHS